MDKHAQYNADIGLVDWKTIAEERERIIYKLQAEVKQLKEKEVELLPKVRSAFPQPRYSHGQVVMAEVPVRNKDIGYDTTVSRKVTVCGIWYDPVSHGPCYMYNVNLLNSPNDLLLSLPEDKLHLVKL
jgi:hypothetical protein